MVDDSLVPGGVAITIRRLAKAFGATAVLNGIDLHVPAGQFLTVIGKSGCGKSTLLRISRRTRPADLRQCAVRRSPRRLLDARCPADVPGTPPPAVVARHRKR